MKQNFTPNHLLLAAYGELATQATSQLQDTLLQNESLNEDLQEIINCQIVLDSFMLQPNKSSIAFILEHSRETETAA